MGLKRGIVPIALLAAVVVGVVVVASVKLFAQNVDNRPIGNDLLAGICNVNPNFPRCRPKPSTTPTPTAVSTAPEAPADIECKDSWTNVKELGGYAHNAMVNFNDQYLLLTTVEHNTTENEQLYGQEVVFRKMNPLTGFDSGWQKAGFAHSQNSQVLLQRSIDSKTAVDLYVYGNVGSSLGKDRKVFVSSFKGDRGWPEFKETKFNNLGRTGPATAYLGGELWRFRAVYGPTAVLQKCQKPYSPSPVPSPIAPPSAPVNLTAYAFDCAIFIKWKDNSENETGFIIQARTDSENEFQTIKDYVGLSPGADNVFTEKWTGGLPGGKYFFRVGATNAAGTNWTDPSEGVVRPAC